MSKESNADGKTSKSRTTEPLTPKSKNSIDTTKSNINSNNQNQKSPSSTAKQAPAPTIEQYNSVKQKLTAQILRKQLIDAKLTELEERIYDKETGYFQESSFGNIVKGFDNFGKTSGGGVVISGSGSNIGGGSSGGGLLNGSYGGGSGGGGGGNMKRKIIYTDDDHIFSLSSTSFMKTLLRRQGISRDDDVDGDISGNGSQGGHAPNGDGNNGTNNAGEPDLDDYEDSVDPSEAGQGSTSQTAGEGGVSTSGTATPNNNSAIATGSGTPTSSSGRKRKIRSFDD